MKFLDALEYGALVGTGFDVIGELEDGAFVGNVVGAGLGKLLGETEGDFEGPWLGGSVGDIEGLRLGDNEDALVGVCVELQY